ncbi:hypothetical protein AST12_08360 [Staphylococcus succinus]|nr:hypothetical protein AST12_08360 [Staphylococcus succinus]
MMKREILLNIVSELKNQKNDEFIEKIAKNMNLNYNIPEGVSISFTSRELDDSFFMNTDIRLITLYIMEAFKVMGRTEMLNDYILKGEQQEAKQFDFKAYKKQDEIQLPYEFSPALPVNDVYSTKMSVKEISDFVNSGIINYNFDIQREAKLEKRLSSVVKVPTINQKNVNEITKHLLNGTLKESTLYLNAAPTTSDSGDELMYDPNDHILAVTEGTRIDVLDGYHRLLATQKAFRENPTIKFEFNVVISNFTTSEAIKWQAQHSKATSWSKNRVTEMQQETKSAKVVKAIKDSDTEFDELIYTGQSRQGLRSSLITYNQLTRVIDECFTIESRREEVKIADDLSDILLLINEVKKANKTLRSQMYINAFVKLYKEDYNSNIKDYIEFLNNVLEYSYEKEYDFALHEKQDAQAKRIAYNKLKELEQILQG